MSLTTYLTKQLKPKGVNRIVFSNQPTQVRFKWDLRQNEGATIILNQTEFDRLSPELRYFVLMHEIGHLEKMTFPTIKATPKDEDEADQYAIEACAKSGIFFESATQARQLYHQAFL